MVEQWRTVVREHPHARGAFRSDQACLFSSESSTGACHPCDFR